MLNVNDKILYEISNEISSIGTLFPRKNCKYENPEIRMISIFRELDEVRDVIAKVNDNSDAKFHIQLIKFSEMVDSLEIKAKSICPSDKELKPEKSGNSQNYHRIIGSRKRLFPSMREKVYKLINECK